MVQSLRMASVRRSTIAGLAALALVAAGCSSPGAPAGVERVLRGDTKCAGQSIASSGDITNALVADAVVEVSSVHPVRAFTDPALQNDIVFDLDVSRVLYRTSSATIDPPRRVPAVASHARLRAFEPVACATPSSFASTTPSTRTLVLLTWEDTDGQTQAAATKWAVRPVLSESSGGGLTFDGAFGDINTEWRAATQLPLARRYGSQRALLVAWVSEIHESRRQGATVGPITAALQAATRPPSPPTTPPVATVSRSLLVQIDPATERRHLWLRVLTRAGVAFQSDMAGTYNLAMIDTPRASPWTVQLVRVDHPTDSHPPVVVSLEVPPTIWNPQFATLLRITPQFASGEVHDGAQLATTLTYLQMQQWLQARSVPGHPEPEP
jgi:hypothetical protein